MDEGKIRASSDTEGYTALVSEPTAVRAGQQIAREYLALSADERAADGGDRTASRTETAFGEHSYTYLARLHQGETIDEDGLSREEKLALHMAQYIITAETLGATTEDARKFVGDWAVAMPTSSVPTANREYI